MFSGFTILIAGNLLEYIQNINWPIFIIGLVIVFAKIIACIDTFISKRKTNTSRSSIDNYCYIEENCLSYFVS